MAGTELLTTTEKAQYDQNFIWYNNIKDVPITDNNLLNGDFGVSEWFDIDTTPVAAVNSTYQIDRYKSYFNVTTGTIQRMPKSLINGNFVHSVKCIATSPSTGTIGLNQIVELTYNGEKKAYGAWVKSNSVSARIVLGDGVGTTASSTHSGGGSWEFLSLSRTINIAATTLIAYVVISSPSAGIISISSGDYIEMTMCQLESGSISNPFKQIDDSELIKCQKYFQKIFRDVAGNNDRISGSSISTTKIRLTVSHKVTMRVAPAVSFSSLSHMVILDGVGTNQGAPTSLSANAMGLNSSRIDAEGTGLVAGQGAELALIAAGYIAFDAEIY